MKSKSRSYQRDEKYFDVKVEKVDQDKLPTPLAKDGVRTRVTTKPGLPLGRFDGWLDEQISDAEKLEIPIFGRVVRNISVTALLGRRRAACGLEGLE